MEMPHLLHACTNACARIDKPGRAGLRRLPPSQHRRTRHMTPFTIAGVQMHLGVRDNIDAMRQRLDILMHLHPSVQMVVFSELAPFGPLLENAQTLPGPAEQAFQDMARRHRLWLVTGSMFEKRDD